MLLTFWNHSKGFTSTALLNLLTFNLKGITCLRGKVHPKVRYGDTDCEETLEKWSTEIDDENISGIDKCHNDECEQSEHDANSKLSASENKDRQEYVNTEQQQNDESTTTSDLETNNQEETTSSLMSNLKAAREQGIVTL